MKGRAQRGTRRRRAGATHRAAGGSAHAAPCRPELPWPQVRLRVPTRCGPARPGLASFFSCRGGSGSGGRAAGAVQQPDGPGPQLSTPRLPATSDPASRPELGLRSPRGAAGRAVHACPCAGHWARAGTSLPWGVSPCPETSALPAAVSSVCFGWVYHPRVTPECEASPGLAEGAQSMLHR